MFITINGIVCEALEGDTVMQAARRNGIHIPGLCHHDALPGQACCRLCLVEILQQKSKTLVASCVYPAAEGLSVVTDSPEITIHRKNILTMIRESAPNATGLSELYDEYGVTLDKRFCDAESNKCMLCGLCVRACREMGASAISTNWRGVGKKVGTAFDEPSGDCVGCGACAGVCPTNAIERIEVGSQRQIWGKTFELAACEQCGEPVATCEEIELLARRSAFINDPGILCAKCRRKVAANAF